jgi:biopolymer transport protein ExbB
MFLSILLQAASTVAVDTSAAASPANQLPNGLWELTLKGGIVMIPIGVMFVIAIFITIERWLTLNKAGKIDANFMSSIKDMVLNDNIVGAQTLCSRTNTPMAKMIEKGISRIGNPLKNIEVAVENVGKLEVYKLEKGMPWLATISGAAPMLGFLGTVIGMIQAFDKIEAAGNMDASLVAGGIKVALLTTVFGLIVAMILQVFYNYITAKIDAIVNDMEDASISLVDLLLDHNK